MPCEVVRLQASRLEEHSQACHEARVRHRRRAALRRAPLEHGVVAPSRRRRHVAKRRGRAKRVASDTRLGTHNNVCAHLQTLNHYRAITDWPLQTRLEHTNACAHRKLRISI